MNAVEFVREFGFKASHELMNAECWTMRQIAMSTCIDDKDELQRLVDSWELVQIHGLENSKKIVANAPSDEHFYSWTLGNSGVKDKTVNIGELRKAIADVESVGGGGENLWF